MTYDEDRDAFIPKKPFNSWILNEILVYGNPLWHILMMVKVISGTNKIKLGI
jgi:hypothetical protein